MTLPGNAPSPYYGEYAYHDLKDNGWLGGAMDTQPPNTRGDSMVGMEPDCKKIIISEILKTANFNLKGGY